MIDLFQDISQSTSRTSHNVVLSVLIFSFIVSSKCQENFRILIVHFFYFRSYSSLDRFPYTCFFLNLPEHSYSGISPFRSTSVTRAYRFSKRAFDVITDRRLSRNFTICIFATPHRRKTLPKGSRCRAEILQSGLQDDRQDGSRSLVKHVHA